MIDNTIHAGVNEDSERIGIEITFCANGKIVEKSTNCADRKEQWNELAAREINLAKVCTKKKW